MSPFQSEIKTILYLTVAEIEILPAGSLACATPMWDFRPRLLRWILLSSSVTLSKIKSKSLAEQLRFAYEKTLAPPLLPSGINIIINCSRGVLSRNRTHALAGLIRATTTTRVLGLTYAPQCDWPRHPVVESLGCIGARHGYLLWGWKVDGIGNCPRMSGWPDKKQGGN